MRRPDLIADCAACEAVCCIALPFDASEDFALDKPAGEPCPNLAPDHRCSIHDELLVRGFPGCVAYECYGAGPRVTRLFSNSPDVHARHEAFLVLRVVHELLWLLTEATRLVPESQTALAAEVAEEIAALDAIAASSPAALGEADVRTRQQATHALLRRVGEALGGRRAAASRLKVVSPNG